MDRLSVVLADEHPIVRHGLRAALEAESDIQIVGEVADGLAVLDAIQSLRPDILILDVALPGQSGFGLAQQANSVSPTTRTILFSMCGSEADILEALRSGAMGYVDKSASAELLIEAIRTVMSGRRYLSPPYSERAFELYVERTGRGTPDVYNSLTRREEEVFKWIAQGYKNSEIGAHFAISPRTVEVHRARIMQKLGLASARDLIRFALNRGLLTRDGPEITIAKR